MLKMLVHHFASLNVRTFFIIAFIWTQTTERCSATVDIGFWRSHQDLAFSTNLAAELVNFGITNVHEICSFALTNNTYLAPMLAAIAVLEKTSGGYSCTSLVEKAMSLIKGTDEWNDRKLGAMRFLMNRYSSDPQVAREMYRCIDWRMPLAASLAVLRWIGEESVDEPLKFQRLAWAIIQQRRFFALTGMTPPGRDRVEDFLHAVRGPVFSDSAMANQLADLLLEREKGTRYRYDKDEIIAVTKYLLSESSADTNKIVTGLVGWCCGDSNRASVVIWLINEQRDSNGRAEPILEAISRDCPRRRALLNSIRDGKLTRQEAVDEPLSRLEYKQSREDSR